MKRLLLLAIALISLFLYRCDQKPVMTKFSYIEKFEVFINEIGENYKQYTLDDWMNSDSAFVIYSKVYYEKFKDTFEPDELDNVNRLVGKYEGYKMKGKSKIYIEKVIEKVDETIEKTKGFKEALFDNLDSSDSSDSIKDIR